MKCLPYVAASLLALAACQSHPSQTTTPGLAPGASQPPTNAATVASSPGTAYQVYRTLLPGQADSSTLHLLSAPRIFEGATGHFGSYYGANGHPHTLQGQPSMAPDSVVLFATGPDQAPDSSGSSLYWRLRRQPGRGDLVGTVGSQPVRLRLVPAPAGALTFAVRYFVDSAAAFPREAKSPKGRLSLQALVPTGGPAATHETLVTSLLRDLRGDTVAGLPPQPLPAFYQQRRKQFFKDYRADAVASRPAPTDTAGVGAYGIGMNYEDQTATYVLYQQGDLLSLGYFRYDYSGGAHGNYGTTGASYDLRTGQRLRYADIFRPPADAQLAALLGRAVRPLVGLAPNEPLDKQLFVKQMPVTHNVFLTNGGAVFTYQPYEIASYAQGELAVFVPLAELQPLLRDGLPLPTPGGVAVR